MKLVRYHSELNKITIAMVKESIQNVFVGLTELYNKKNDYEPLYLTKQELWEMSGYTGKYDSRYIQELIKNLTRSETFNLGTKISGSLFVTEEIEDGYKVYIPQPFRKYIFIGKDLHHMKLAKNKSPMTSKERDYYETVVKPKKPFLLLLKKADWIGISGNYNKKLYAFLMQFTKTGKYFENWDRFKRLLEIPESYRASDIDKQVLNPAKQELKKYGLIINKIVKNKTNPKTKKNGRKIQKIEIYFKYIDPDKDLKVVKKNEAVTDIKMPEITAYEHTEIEKMKSDLSVKLREKGFQPVKNAEIFNELANCEINEEIERFIEKYIQE